MGVMELEVAEVPVYAYFNDIFIKNFRLEVTVSITLESKSSGIPVLINWVYVLFPCRKAFLDSTFLDLYF